MATILCNRCGIEKDIGQFYFDKKRNIQCKTCNSCNNEWKKLPQAVRAGIKLAGFLAKQNRTEKICPKCSQLLHIDNFALHKSSIDGHAGHCKMCSNTTSKQSKYRNRLPIDQQPTEKHCNKCNTTFPISQFTKSRHNKDGYNIMCKACAHTKWKKHGDDPEARKRWLLSRIRTKCKQQNIPFDLTLDDLVIPEVCPILGIPLQFGIKQTTDFKNKKQATPNDSPSVDRIIPEKGYVKGNIVVISFRANNIKTNATIDELRKIADFYTTLLQPNRN